jgi:pyruvate dehydrogenase complex dehydrogenase (E1) component
VAALDAAARRGDVDRVLVASAIERFGIETELSAPWTR